MGNPFGTISATSPPPIKKTPSPIMPDHLALNRKYASTTAPAGKTQPGRPPPPPEGGASEGTGEVGTTGEGEATGAGTVGLIPCPDPYVHLSTEATWLRLPPF